MKLNNVTEIRPDDFDKEERNTIGQLAQIINPFMQQVVEIVDKRIDFENRVENYLEIEMTVDGDGTPILNNKINTGKTSIRGTEIIAAFNTVNPTQYATAKPFISFTRLAGGVIQVDNIRGLIANQKFRLNIIIY